MRAKLRDQEPGRVLIELMALTRKDRILLRKIIDEGLSKSARTDFVVDTQKKYIENVDGVTLHFNLERK